MQDAAGIFEDPISLAQRLSELNVSMVALRTAVAYGSGFALDCTEHDPPSASGYIGWEKTVRYLRDVLVPQGWQKNDSQNYSTVVHPKLGYRIAAANGDANTGRSDRNPAPRSDKGSVTKAAVSVNQLDFFAVIDATATEPDRLPAGKRRTWLLMFYIDHEAEEVRLELSLPSEISDDGRIEGWRERLILPPVAFGTPVGPHQDDQDDDKEDDDDFEVKRRSS